MTLLQSFDLNDGYLRADINPRRGQSFKLTQGALITSVKFRLSKVNSPTGNLTAEIWAHSGTFGSGAVPTGSALAVSTNSIDVSTLPTDASASVLSELTFTPYAIAANVPYFLIAAHTPSSPNFAELHGHNVGGGSAHAGNGVQFISGNWVASASTDFDFYLYGTYVAPYITGVQSITGISSITF